jgi:hypothetical protein
VLVVARLDRLARSTRDLLNIMAMIAENRDGLPQRTRRPSADASAVRQKETSSRFRTAIQPGNALVLNLADVIIAEFISQAREINCLAEILLSGLLRRIDAGEEVEAELPSSILNQPAPAGTTPDEASSRISRSDRNWARRALYRSPRACSLERNHSSGHEHDFAAGMAAGEILIGLAHIGQRIDLCDRDLEAAGIDQAGKFR